MIYNYSFTYLSCQSCTAKIHCEDCALNLRERLLRFPGVETAEIDINNRRMRILGPRLDEDDLLDLLEDMGIFAD